MEHFPVSKENILSFIRGKVNFCINYDDIEDQKKLSLTTSDGYTLSIVVESLSIFKDEIKPSVGDLSYKEQVQELNNLKKEAKRYGYKLTRITDGRDW